MTVVVLLAPLLDRWPTATSFAEIVAALDDGGAEVVVPDVARAFLLAGLATHAGAAANPPLVAVTATSADAEALAADAAAFLGPERVAVFPAWETLPHEPLSPRSETVARRLALLHRLARQAAGEAPETPEQAPLALLAVPARAVMQPLAPGLDVIEPVRVARGDQMDLEDLLERLVAAGYERTDMVERRGEVAVRGGLVDFFPPGDDHPVRVEFWGDEVEGIRAFAVASQRSLTELPAALAFPCRELRLTAAERQRARQLAAEFPAAGELLSQVADGLAVEGLESLLPLLFDELRLLPDYLPAGAVLALVDPKRTVDRAEEVRLQAEEAAQASWAAAAEGGRAPVEGAGYRPLAEVLAGSGRPVLRVGPFDPGGPGVLRVDAHAIEPYRANVTRVATDARALAADGYTVLLCTEGAGPAERLRDVLRDEGLPVPLAVEPPAAGAAVGTAALLNGFRLPELKLALLAEGDLYGTRRQTREQARMPVTRRRDPQAGGAVALEELQPGDVVVHAVHGIARYVGMEHRTVAGAERDYLLLAYDQGDRLYLPSEQVQMISRYVGGESPKLSRLGSRDWDRQKARVRRKVREMAAELVRLYSARMASPGHAFGPDTPWQRELEDTFPFPETPDQLSAVEQIKADMEAPVPMDRLLCGDVGYGKTEVAVRAAFKTVMDGKQVAVLVPTTLLAQQHHATFSERFASFPVSIELLTRYYSPKEQKEIVRKIEAGEIDIVVGTHRLLSKDIHFKDLGLLVIDEEQRFGVAQKERLKQMKKAVDVLSMSATPIPRTLHMSLVGIRDISVIETPPKDRLAIQTAVVPFNDDFVREAVEFEVGRGGQIFFVHNRVESIYAMKEYLEKIVPGLRVIVGHGQMDERELERAMLAFINREFDVLLATTIIENGIDIPACNTILINHAERFGLSQLYQLRGRVGRSDRLAFCYLLVPSDKILTSDARKDRKSTRLNSSHVRISYAVFCL